MLREAKRTLERIGDRSGDPAYVSRVIDLYEQEKKIAERISWVLDQYSEISAVLDRQLSSMTFIAALEQSKAAQANPWVDYLLRSREAFVIEGNRERGYWVYPSWSRLESIRDSEAGLQKLFDEKLELALENANAVCFAEWEACETEPTPAQVLAEMQSWLTRPEYTEFRQPRFRETARARWAGYVERVRARQRAGWNRSYSLLQVRVPRSAPRRVNGWISKLQRILARSG